MADSEHNVKININGNAASAVGALGRVKSAIESFGKGVAFVSNALGKLNWAIHGIQMLAQAFKWLKDKIGETARELANFKWNVEMRSAANETARLVGQHEKLAKLLKDELDTLAKQRAVGDIEAQAKKDAEDGKREAERARQIYEAKTPEEERELRDRFAAEDEQREREERKDGRKRRIERLDDEESSYTAKANKLRSDQADIDKQLEYERMNVKRAANPRIRRGETEESDEEKAVKARVKALEETKKANDAQIAEWEKEAKFRRDQIAALRNVRDYEGPSAGDWQRKTEAKRREEEAFAERQREAYEGDRRAQEFVDDYEREKAEEEQVAAAAADRRAGDMEGFASRAASVDGVSQNRLTAMGLGSGVSASGTVQSDVRKLVDLLKENVKATKNIHLGDLPDATYSE